MSVLNIVCSWPSDGAARGCKRTRCDWARGFTTSVPVASRDASATRFEPNGKYEDGPVNRRGRLAMILVAATALFIGLMAWRLRPIVVDVVRTTRDVAVDAIYATGVVEPSVMVPVAPRIAGHLRELLVDEGDTVRKGQLLARLDDTDLEGTVDELEAHERYALDVHQRTQELVRRGVIAAAELVRTRSDLEAARAARTRAQSQQAFANLAAPADGTVIRRDGEVGQLITVGQAVFDIACCAPLRVTAAVDEEDVSRVRAGQRVLMRFDAVPGRVLDGEVTEITPKGDPVARSYRVRIRIADPQRLAIGMTADANLIVSEHENALLVPTSAIQNDSVWIVRGGRLHRQRIQVGISSQTLSEISRGLQPGSWVAVSPSADWSEGQHVHSRAIIPTSPKAR